MDLAQGAMAVAVGAALMGINTAFLLDKKAKDIERLYKCVDRLTWMIKDMDPQFAEERAIYADVSEDGGVDGWAIIQIEKRKKAEGKPLYFDPLLPEDNR